MVRWVTSRSGKILLLGSCCLLLQQVVLSYEFSLRGITSNNASLIHLAVGLLLAIAMLDRDRWVVAGCVVLNWLGWLVRALHNDFPASAVLGSALTTLLSFGWMLLCVRWMGWPRMPGHERVQPDDVLRFAVVGLLLYPLGLALIGASLITASVGDGAGIGMVRAVMAYFAKYFGVVVLTLPIVVGWSERHRVRMLAPPMGRLRLPVTIAVVVLSLWLAEMTRSSWSGGQGGGVVLMNYRIVLFAVTGWWMLHLRPPWAMALLSCVLFLMVQGLTHSTAREGGVLDVLNLFHVGMEQGVLSTAMLYYLLVGRDRSDLESRLHEEARRDSLTGLPNLNALRGRVESMAQPAGEIGYLLLDRADSLAAGFGLEAQASVMNAVAARIAGQAQPYYLGTGQFAVVLAGRDNQATWSALQASVEQADFTIGAQRLRVLPYLGVAGFGLDQASRRESVEKALLMASNLAFEARRTNEVRPLFADGSNPALQQAQRQQLFDATQALEALHKDRLELFFQPIVALQGQRETGRMHGEVLCRLRDAQGKLVEPARFVSSLEAVRRGPELDLAVLGELFRQLRAMPACLPLCDRLSVNLTGQSLASDSFETRFRALLADSPLPLSCLCFEITETAAITSIARARAMLDELRAQGCRIAIDDFGVGMQSFSRLRELPIDIIKMDGSFVRNITRDQRDRAMVQASVAIAQAIDAEVVAEFVEDEAIEACLQHLGVQWGQGYLYARPVPLADAFALVQQAVPGRVE